MTELFDASEGVSLGSGKFLSPGSLKDSELAGQLMRYRRSVASAYSSVSPDEISSSFTAGPFHISPKVDGELWFLIFDDGDSCDPSIRLHISQVSLLLAYSYRHFRIHGSWVSC